MLIKLKKKSDVTCALWNDSIYDILIYLTTFIILLRSNSNGKIKIKPKSSLMYTQSHEIAIFRVVKSNFTIFCFKSPRTYLSIINYSVEKKISLFTNANLQFNA